MKIKSILLANSFAKARLSPDQVRFISFCNGLHELIRQGIISSLIKKELQLDDVEPTVLNGFIPIERKYMEHFFTRDQSEDSDPWWTSFEAFNQLLHILYKEKKPIIDITAFFLDDKDLLFVKSNLPISPDYDLLEKLLGE